MDNYYNTNTTFDALKVGDTFQLVKGDDVTYTVKSIRGPFSDSGRIELYVRTQDRYVGTLTRHVDYPVYLF